MAKGYYLVLGDKTTCGGRIIEGATDHLLFGKPQARDGDKVICGQHPGIYVVAGGIPGDTIHGRMIAGTLHSVSSCPCRARLVPSILEDCYEKGEGSASSGNNATQPLPSYLTGEKKSSEFIPDYPVLRNTHDLPDEKIRALLKGNSHDVMFLTLTEVFEVLSSWGAWKYGWKNITDSVPGQIIVNYGTNIKDVVTTSILISQLGSYGIKATMYLNEQGTELIKLSGYPGIRKILNAPVFAAKNPKIVDVGIGKYGLANSIVEGARLTFYVAAAYRTINYIMNDEVRFSEFIGSLATDVVKIGISSAVIWTVGTIIATPWVVLNLAVVVVVGTLAAITLNYLDEKFGVTDKVVAYIESAQQEFANKAREVEGGLIDLGAMYAEKMLIKGREFIVYEVKRYFRSNLNSIPRELY
ncbi:PAAR domain-containing protein [Pluralibacter gergoviae]|uniref:PAAR domain-containing protein n=1 Tax=Pluralibacter gergoviae TaxID=61647 RepID=UPI0008DBF758|nr:PAAR domain-containing protein [Pluralibacter gergoviae]EKV3546157.1 PAAR domain-containing protein [Pluralibacter gergoviae]EKV9901087.1 PAAR domain-containing protein [Pluralibacter gergoviae]EKV9931678.1 PAAR domain-containing protein [Pluralibacter gergoviae]EKW6620383.1 PAAR domain-containing protein [Pluralibacter gergoviae]EKW9978282.1 PAAR domain-containing protein [Pluralibacter gergoviae]